MARLRAKRATNLQGTSGYYRYLLNEYLLSLPSTSSCTSTCCVSQPLRNAAIPLWSTVVAYQNLFLLGSIHFLYFFDLLISAISNIMLDVNEEGINTVIVVPLVIESLWQYFPNNVHRKNANVI
jgi:hypothetical protein